MGANHGVTFDPYVYDCTIPASTRRIFTIKTNHRHQLPRPTDYNFTLYSKKYYIVQDLEFQFYLDTHSGLTRAEF